MAMTDEELTDIARALAGRIYVQALKTADENLTTLKTAVGNIDTAMNATTTQAAALYPGAVIKQAMLDRAQAGAPNLTVAEAGIALAYWALREVNLL